MARGGQLRVMLDLLRDYPSAEIGVVVRCGTLEAGTGRSYPIKEVRDECIKLTKRAVLHELQIHILQSYPGSVNQCRYR